MVIAVSASLPQRDSAGHRSATSSWPSETSRFSTFGNLSQRGNRVLSRQVTHRPISEDLGERVRTIAICRSTLPAVDMLRQVLLNHVADGRPVSHRGGGVGRFLRGCLDLRLGLPFRERVAPSLTTGPSLHGYRPRLREREPSMPQPRCDTFAGSLCAVVDTNRVLAADLFERVLDAPGLGAVGLARRNAPARSPRSWPRPGSSFAASHDLAERLGMSELVGCDSGWGFGRSRW